MRLKCKGFKNLLDAVDKQLQHTPLMTETNFFTKFEVFECMESCSNEEDLNNMNLTRF